MLHLLCSAPFSLASGLCQSRVCSLFFQMAKWPSDRGHLMVLCCLVPLRTAAQGGGLLESHRQGRQLSTPRSPPLNQAGLSPFCSPCPAEQLIPRAIQCHWQGDRESLATMGPKAELWGGRAALCQLLQCVAAEQVSTGLRRINFYLPHFCGARGALAPGVPLPQAAVLLQCLCQCHCSLPSILIRFSTSPPSSLLPKCWSRKKP